MTFPMEEPPADMRQAAKISRDMFVALCNAGFTEQQALQIIGFSIIASGLNGPPSG